MTETAYTAHTNNAFILNETVAVAELMHRGATQEEIRQQVIKDDLFQLRSKTQSGRYQSGTDTA